MRFLLLLFALSSSALADSLDKECYFHKWWANRMLYAQERGLPEEGYHILQDGFPKEVYDLIQSIKREAYHDMPALVKRVEKACAPKVNT